jgi:plasmid stabilization system protein ParE
MGSSPFQFHPGAREEFRNAVRGYRSQNHMASAEFRLIVSDEIRLISQAPHRWPKYLHGTRRFVMQRFPFSVIYLEESNLVTIVAVAHGRRRPGYWKDRV